MRIVVSEFISLDGVVQAPGGPDEDTDGGGRRTWEGMAAAWPGRAGDPFADRMNAIDKHVVSGTLAQSDLAWENSTLIAADGALERIRELRAADGGDLLIMGSPTLVRALLAEGLVDELVLMIEPVLLGGGKSIFPTDGALRTMALVSTQAAPTGVQVCVYRPAAGD